MTSESPDNTEDKSSFGLDWLREFGARTLLVLDYAGGIAYLAYQSVRVIPHYRFPLRALIHACEFVGVRSLSLVLVIMVFTGMVLALQFTVGLSRFGLELYVGQIIGISIIRELGPVLTSLMIAARVGSGIAAELGSMVATEQVLAIEALGGNPVQKLVLPRILATTLMTPLLTTVGNIVGILGGMVITVMEAGVTTRFYYDQIQRTVEMSDIVSGLVKTVFFGFFVGLIACYEGLSTRGGTVGVGRSTTYAVVISSLTIFISDFFLTKFFIVIYGY